MVSESRCCVCDEQDGAGDRETRPYGPNGADICFGCANATPDAQKQAQQQFSTKLSAAGLRAILTQDGPLPFVIPDETPEA